MTGAFADPDLEALGQLFADGFRSSPKNYQTYLRQQAARAGADYEPSPLKAMRESSPLVGYARQALPHRMQDVEWARSLIEALPDGKFRDALMSTPLGGMSGGEKESFSKARAADPALRRATVEIGRARVPGGVEEELIGPGNYRAQASQVAGVAASDFVQDGLRNIWWFLNAPQALTTIAMLQGMHAAGENVKKELGSKVMPVSADTPLVRNRGLRMAATAPAWIAMSMGIGNFGREEGYKATLPSEIDPRETVDPVGEALNRYFLGRTGNLLKYDEFVKERPDVSKGEYEAYKAYLHGNNLPVKATLDGIHGPEVTFMGKSIPLATGILPAVAGVIGARRGVRVAAKRLAGEGAYAREDESKAEYAKIRQQFEDPTSKAKITQKEVENAYNEYLQLKDSNEAQVLKSVLANSGGSVIGTALAGHVLESLRRAVKGKAPVEEESQAAT